MSVTKITTPGYTDQSVTTDKLANDSVTTDKITFENSLVPTGAVFHFASASAPTGYLVCDGSTIPNGQGTVQGKTANFSALYAIVASTYGSAGQLPDLRGEFIRGWDGGKGVDSERQFGTFQSDLYKSHKHSIIMSHEVNGGKDNVGYPAVDGSAPYVFHSENEPDGSYTQPGGYGNPLYSSGGVETRPRNIALLPCIKY